MLITTTRETPQDMTQRFVAETIIVCEEQPRWSAELRRQFAGTDVTIRHCTRIPDIPLAISPVNRHVVVIALGRDLPEGLRFLARSEQSANELPVIVIGGQETAAFEWALREAGSSAYLPITTTGPQLAKLCRRLSRLSFDPSTSIQD